MISRLTIRTSPMRTLQVFTGNASCRLKVAATYVNKSRQQCLCAFVLQAVPMGGQTTWPPLTHRKAGLPPFPRTRRRLQASVGVERHHAVEHRFEAGEHGVQQAAELRHLFVPRARGQCWQQHRKHLLHR